ncbi:hypothetical protein [Streptomyces sp. NPDC001665]
MPAIGRAREDASLSNTTDVEEPFDEATVFAMYVSLGLGALVRAHAGGPAAQDLIVVGEIAPLGGGGQGNPCSAAPIGKALHSTEDPTFP